MPQSVDVAGFGIVEFPDGYSPEQIKSELDARFANGQSQAAPAPTEPAPSEFRGWEPPVSMEQPDAWARRQGNRNFVQATPFASPEQIQQVSEEAAGEKPWEIARDVPGAAIKYSAGAIGKGLQAATGKLLGTGDSVEDLLGAVWDDKTLPVEEAASKITGVKGALARGGLSIEATIPKLAMLAAFPESLLAQSVAAGGIFGFDDKGNFSPKSAIIGALMPGVGKLGTQVATKAIVSALEGGSKALQNTAAQWFVEELGQQAALNALLIAGDSPELIKLYQTDPEAAKHQIQEIVGQNLAWALFGGAHHFAGKKPTATQQFIYKNREKYGDIADTMITRQLAGKDGQGAIQAAIEEAKARQFGVFGGGKPKGQDALDAAMEDFNKREAYKKRGDKTKFNTGVAEGSDIVSQIAGERGLSPEDALAATGAARQPVGAGTAYRNAIAQAAGNRPANRATTEGEADAIQEREATAANVGQTPGDSQAVGGGVPPPWQTAVASPPVSEVKIEAPRPAAPIVPSGDGTTIKSSTATQIFPSITDEQILSLADFAELEQARIARGKSPADRKSLAATFPYLGVGDLSALQEALKDPEAFINSARATLESRKPKKTETVSPSITPSVELTEGQKLTLRNQLAENMQGRSVLANDLAPEHMQFEVLKANRKAAVTGGEALPPNLTWEDAIRAGVLEKSGNEVRLAGDVKPVEAPPVEPVPPAARPANPEVSGNDVIPWERQNYPLGGKSRSSGTPEETWEPEGLTADEKIEWQKQNDQFKEEQEKDTPGFLDLKEELGNIGYRITLDRRAPDGILIFDIGDNNRTVAAYDLPSNALKLVEDWLNKKTSKVESAKVEEVKPEPQVPKAAESSNTPAKSVKALDLQPALVIDGKNHTGESDHTRIANALLKTGMDDKKIFAALNDDAAHVFVDKEGTPYSRKSAATALGETEPLNSARLKELQDKETAALPPEPVFRNRNLIIRERDAAKEAVNEAARKLKYAQKAGNATSPKGKRAITKASGELVKAEEAHKALVDELAERDRVHPYMSGTTRGRRRFANETNRGNHDVMEWMQDNNVRVLSLSSARKKGKEFWGQHSAEWDGVISSQGESTLTLPPHHSDAIYGGGMPSTVAKSAFDAGKISEPTPDALWEAIRQSHAKRMGGKGGEERDAKFLDEREAETIAWQTATKRRSTATPVKVDPTALAKGETMEVGGEKLEVASVDADGNVVVRGGDKFGNQEFNQESEPFWVTKYTPVERDVDFAPEETAEVVPAKPASRELAIKTSQEGGIIFPGYDPADVAGTWTRGMLADLQLSKDATPQERFFVDYANAIRREMRRRHGETPKETDAKKLQDEANTIGRMVGGKIGDRVTNALKVEFANAEASLRGEGMTDADAAKIIAKINSTGQMVADLVAGASPMLSPKAEPSIMRMTASLWKTAHNMIQEAVYAMDPTLSPEEVSSMATEIMGGKPQWKRGEVVKPKAIESPKPPEPKPEVVKPVEKPAEPAVPVEKPDPPVEEKPEVVVKPAKEGVPVGTVQNGYIKHTDGRWYKAEDDGKIAFKENGKPKRIPTNESQTERIEQAAQAALDNPETRSPLEILNSAKLVDVSAPPGTTKLRVTDNRGRKAEIWLKDFKNGNPAYQSDIVKIEAGSVNKSNTFTPIAGDVKISERPKLPPAVEKAKAKLPKGQNVRVDDDLSATGGKPESTDIASVAPDGTIVLHGPNLADALESFRDPARAQRWLEQVLHEEAIHKVALEVISEREAANLWRATSKFSQAALIRAYTGLRQSQAEAGYSDSQLGHELLRRRMQRALGGETTEQTRSEGWSERTKQYVLNLAERVLTAFKKTLSAGNDVGTMLANRLEAALQGKDVAKVEGEYVDRPAATVPEGEKTEEPKKNNRSFLGEEKTGVEYDVESIAKTVEAVRAKVFDGTKGEVNEATTANAWEILGNMTRPETRNEFAADVVSEAGGQGSAGALLNELLNYAQRLAIRGDTRMFRTLLGNQEFIQTLNVGPDAKVVGKSASGLDLRYAREGASPLWKSVVIYAKALSEVAGQKIGVGEEKFNRILEAMDNLVSKIGVEDFDRLIAKEETKSGKTIADLLEENSPERKAAEQVVLGIPEGQIPERAPGIEGAPKVRATILETVYEWLKRDVGKDDEAMFTTSLKEALVKLRLTEEQAQAIADGTWVRKNTVESARRKALWDSELRRLDNLANKTAEGFIKTVDVAEWKKLAQPNEVRDIIRNALKKGGDLAETEQLGWKQAIDESNMLGFKSALIEKLKTAGVDEGTAQRLADAITSKRSQDLANAQMKSIERAAASQNVYSLVEDFRNAPYLSQNNPEWRLASATRWFESNGLTKEQAVEAAKIFDKQFVNAMVMAAEKEARRLLEKGSIGRLGDILSAVRLGLTDPSKNWIDEIANRKNFRPISAEQQKLAAEIDMKLSNPELSPEEIGALQEQLYKIFRHVGWTEGNNGQAFAERYVSGLLSGPRTFMVQWGPAMQALRDFPTQAISDPKNSLNIASAMYRAWKNNFLPQLKYAWQKRAYGFHIEHAELQHQELRKRWEAAEKEYNTATSPVVKAHARLKQLYNVGHFVVHLLNSMDQAMMATAREWKMVYYASSAFKDAGLGTGKVSELMDAMAIARQNAYDTAIDAGLDPLTAKIRANWTVTQAVEDFVSNHTGEMSMGNRVMKAAEHDIYSMVGRQPKGITEMDEGFLSKPINGLIKKLSEAKKDGSTSILATALFGFVNIPFRTMRFYSSYSPYGLLRYGINKYRTNRGMDTYWKQSFANELQAKARFREAIAGTVVMGLATAWAAANNTSDDKAGSEKFGAYITGNGPQSRVLRDAWDKKGWKPFSINFVINGRVVPIPITRIGESIMFPFMLAAAVDDAQWKRKAIAATGKEPPSLPSSFASTLVGTLFQMTGQKGILQGPTQWARLAEGGSGTTKIAAKLGATVGSAFVVPLKQLFSSISDMFAGPMDQSSVSSIIASQFPIVGLPLQTKAVNRFGDPLYDRSFYGIIQRTGVPVAFQVAQTEDNVKLYDGLLLQKGAAAPDLRRFDIEEKYGPLSDSDFAKFAQISGSTLKKMVMDNVDSLKEMPPEQVKSFLESSAHTANDLAAAEMNLQPQKATAVRSSGSSGGGYASLGGGVAMPKLPAAPSAAVLGSGPTTRAAASSGGADYTSGGGGMAASGYSGGGGGGGAAPRGMGTRRVSLGGGARVRKPRLVTGKLKSRMGRRVRTRRIGSTIRKIRRVRVRA